MLECPLALEDGPEDGLCGLDDAEAKLMVVFLQFHGQDQFRGVDRHPVDELGCEVEAGVVGNKILASSQDCPVSEAALNKDEVCFEALDVRLELGLLVEHQRLIPLEGNENREEIHLWL